MLYISRFISIMPTVAFVLFIEIFIFQRWLAFNIKAPFFYPSQLSPGNKSMWTYLIFIHNYFPLDTFTICFPTFFYFAADFHLFLITPWIVWLLMKKPKSVKLIFAVLFGISLTINFFYIHHYSEYFKYVEL